jgi:hypothetical protein
MVMVAVDDQPGGAARLQPHAEDAILTVDDLVVLARRAVHPHYVVEGMLTHCQCATCVRVERTLWRVAAGGRHGRAGALADATLATRDAAQRLVNTRSVHDHDAVDARDQTLIRQWREQAAIERADACSPRSMSPALRSVHNHRGLVYDACAGQLAAIHPPKPPL